MGAVEGMMRVGGNYFLYDESISHRPYPPPPKKNLKSECLTLDNVRDIGRRHG